MNLNKDALVFCVTELGLAPTAVHQVGKLLFEEEATVPFIARYRKEVTGNMDEVQIRHIQEKYQEYIEREKRREYILEAIKKMEAMTPELEKQIKKAANLNELESLYAPFKSKKKTKAMIAKENGLEPLAEIILSEKGNKEAILASAQEKFVKDKVKDLNEAFEGAIDILVEKFSHQLEVRKELTETFWKQGLMVSSKKSKAHEISDYDKYRDFFEFTEPLKNLKDPKSSHRYLAMRRGMTQKVLKVETSLDENIPFDIIQSFFFPLKEKLSFYDLLEKAAKKAYSVYLHPSLDLEIKNDLKKIADSAAIDIFGVNLKDLLLQPYLGSHAVMGIDPGVRTGCKVVIIDKTGKFLGDHVVYPFPPRNDIKGSAEIISKMLEVFKITYICVGNGTYGRETLAFLQESVKAVKEKKVNATMISEAGASIYSASDIAREEFPDKDVTVRGAVSIARRFQDPLAELVKIDPKSIGVGQYQHDVNQAQLKKSLKEVVESCVNFVGVDLNTASAPLLSYVSGIGPTVSKQVVQYRDKNGKFNSREELLKVTRFSQKVYEQCAGFLRIYNGKNPLDGTFIHPERYGILEAWAKKHHKSLKELTEEGELQSLLSKDKELEKEIGAMTLKDIISSLKAPTQDPRTVFKSVEFTQGISGLDDIKPGQWYTGVVSNITMFGAFVDIGIKENGLLHISQFNEYVENISDKLKVGQELKVKVLEVDKERKRISLSLKTDSHVQSTSISKASRSKKPQESGFKNNAFGGLKGFKI